MRKRRWAGAAVGCLIFMLGSLPAGASFEGTPGKIVFSGRGEKDGLFLSRRDGSQVMRLTRAQDGSAQWSPLGDKLVFLRFSKDGYGSIHVIRRDGTGRIRLSPPPDQGCGVQFPHWSYDGLFIAYGHDCFDRDPRVAEIRVVTPDGKSHTAVTDQQSLDQMGRQPWSPNLEESSRLTFTSDRDGDHDLYVMNSDGTAVRQLTNEDGFAIDPAWSPDGSLIAYGVQDPAQPRSDLWVVSPEGGDPILLVDGTPHAGDPLWSPDGSRLLFTRATRRGLHSLMAAEADGSNEVEIGDGLHTSVAAWSPNSAAVLVVENGDLVRYRLASPVTRKVLVRNVSPYSTSDWQAR